MRQGLQAFRSTLFSIALLLSPVLDASPLSNPPLRVATEGSYPPFSYFDTHGQLTGFDVDIALALCQEMQRSCDVKAVPWVDLIDSANSGQVDFIVASMARTAERERYLAFSDYYYRSRSIFVGIPERFPSLAPEALSGIRITTGRDTIQASYLQKHYPYSTLLLADDQEQAMELLVQGDADLILSDTINLLDFLQRPASSRFDFIGPPLVAPELQSEAHIAVAKDNTPLLQAINTALSNIRLNGTYEHINRHYFPFSIY